MDKINYLVYTSKGMLFSAHFQYYMGIDYQVKFMIYFTQYMYYPKSRRQHLKKIYTYSEIVLLFNS